MPHPRTAEESPLPARRRSSRLGKRGSAQAASDTDEPADLASSSGTPGERPRAAASPESTGHPALYIDGDEEYARQLQEQEYLGLALLDGAPMRLAHRVERGMIPEDRLMQQQRLGDSFEEGDGCDEDTGSEGGTGSEGEAGSEGPFFWDQLYRHGARSDDERHSGAGDSGDDGDDHFEYTHDSNGDDHVEYSDEGVHAQTFTRLFGFVDRLREPGGRNVLAALGPYIPDEDFDSSYEALLRLSEGIGEVKKRGLSKEAVARLVAVQWTQPAVSRGPEADPSTACAVCLEPYQAEETLMALACGHRFHWGCAKRWLLERATCPVCRQDIQPD